MKQITWPPSSHPLLYASLLDFWQNSKFSKRSFKCPWQQKKVYYIFEEPLNLNIIADLLFSLALRIPGEKESQAEENRYLIWTGDWRGECNTHRHTENTYYFLITNCSNKSLFFELKIILLYFWFLIAGIHLTANSKS